MRSPMLGEFCFCCKQFRCLPQCPTTRQFGCLANSTGAKSPAKVRRDINGVAGHGVSWQMRHIDCFPFAEFSQGK
jgi:hypothetical protein